MAKHGGILTDLGDALITNAWMLGEKVDVTELAVGDGAGAPYTPDAAMTKLKNEVWRGKLAQKVINPASPNRVTVAAYIPAKSGPFCIREIGLFDAQGRLIAIGSTPLIEKTTLQEGSVMDMLVGLEVIIEHLESVNLEVNPYIIGATKLDIEKHNQSAAAHDNLFPRYELARLEHNLGRYPGVAVLGALQWGAGMGGAGETPAGGSDMDGLPVKVRYHSRQSLSIYTIEAAALPGVAKELHGGGTEWTVTYAGNNRDSLYICLDGGQQGGGVVPPPVMPETIKVSPTMGLKIIKEG